MKKLSIAIVFSLAACGQLSGLLGTSDSQNRAILNDVAITSTATASSARGIASTATSTTEGECRGNPFEVCQSDAERFCAEYAPPAPGTPPPADANFENRHQRMHQFMSCMQTNLANLSAACQEVVRNVPSHPPQGQPGQNGGQRRRPEFKRGPGGPPPRHGNCGGKSPLAACVSDAKTLCGAELPESGEVGTFTQDERRERVESIVSCLETQLQNVSADCKAALNKLPRE